MWTSEGETEPMFGVYNWSTPEPVYNILKDEVYEVECISPEIWTAEMRDELGSVDINPTIVPDSLTSAIQTKSGTASPTYGLACLNSNGEFVFLEDDVEHIIKSQSYSSYAKKVTYSFQPSPLPELQSPDDPVSLTFNSRGLSAYGIQMPYELRASNFHQTQDGYSYQLYIFVDGVIIDSSLASGSTNLRTNVYGDE